MENNVKAASPSMRQVPVTPARPLSLSPRIRAKLLSAISTLLSDPRLSDQTHAVQLAAVVLVAKANYPSCQVLITARELGRWLGISESAIAHDVLPLLVRSTLLSTRVVTADNGRTTGVECRVAPLWAARSARQAPLSLSKAELSVLLRLTEALFAPGWVNSATAPGLLASRRHKGAATDRLALLLLTLHSRDDGSVPLVGGPVCVRRGRSAATVARILKCSISGGSKVLSRLRSLGVLQTPLRGGQAGARGKRLLLLPAVAVQQTSPALVKGRTGRVRGNPLPDTASGDLEPLSGGKGTGQQLDSGPPHPCAQVDPAHPDPAPLHTDHASVAAVPRNVRTGSGFSGYADNGNPPLPHPAREREDRFTTTTAAATASRAGVVGQPSPRLPDDLAEGLTPVGTLWASIPRASTRQWLARLARCEVSRIAGHVGPQAAQRVLSERLTRRLTEQLPHSVVDAAGWLVKRGLPQRQTCWSLMCDDGVRIDTGHTCQSCETLMHDLRARRRGITEQIFYDHRISYDHSSGKQADPRSDGGKEMRSRYRLTMLDSRAPGSHTAAERMRRQEAHELRRQRAVELEEAHAAAPCADCGLGDAAGLCLPCTENRVMERHFVEAVNVAVATRFDPDDGAATVSMWEECCRLTRKALDERLRQLEQAGLPSEVVAFTGRCLVQGLLASRRASALAHLAEIENSGQNLWLAGSAVPSERRPSRAREGAVNTPAAGKAVGPRACERKLAHLLAQLRSLRSLAPRSQRVRKQLQ
ncbi:hypothetical protein [Streptomyces sp. NPDC017991]|uniref:hypothetical protein n=1 Tax=Streptomyces sp. NPDC017991 TaxID=3365026 RepID=UPI003789D801